MSYREEDGKVVITLEPLEYERLLTVFSIATSASMNGRGMIGIREILMLLNSINEGNRAYTPYQVEPA